MRDFKKYKVWQDAMKAVEMVYIVAKALPAEEKFALSDQLRRAVVSIPSNIAEGAGRKSVADFLHFLSIAMGSAYETETQLLLCSQLHLAPEELVAGALKTITGLEKQLTLFSASLQESAQTK